MNCDGLVCTFEADAEDPEGSNVTYLWSFGRTSPRTTFTYQSPGTYTESVTATDPLGLESTVEVTANPVAAGATESTSPPQSTTTTPTLATTTTELVALPPPPNTDGGSGLPTWALPLVGVGAIAVLVGVIGTGIRVSSTQRGKALVVGGFGTRIGSAIAERRRQISNWWYRTRLAMATSRRRLFRPITRQRNSMPLFNRLRIGTRASRSRFSNTRNTVESKRRYWQLTLRNFFRFRRGT